MGNSVLKPADFDMTENSRVYLDHNATTPLSPAAAAAVTRHLSDWGNPSSIHWDGRGPKQILREARQSLAQGLGAHPLELVFTSGGTESNNTVVQMILGLRRAGKCTNIGGAAVSGEPGVSATAKNEWITSTVEHPSVLKAFRWLESQGEVVHYIPVNRAGELDRAAYSATLSSRTLLVSIMCANNETGTIFPIGELCAEAHAHGALFHTDAVQALGKIPLDLRALGVDYASFSAHKFYALKGTGVLYYRKGAPWQPLLHGGGQERHRRAGTENVIGIAALGAMAARLAEVPAQAVRLRALRDDFEARLQARLPGITLSTPASSRLANTSHFLVADADGESMLMNLDIAGFSVSTGAACSSGNPEPSPVLLAMGFTRAEAQASLRVTFGWSTTPAETEKFLEALESVVRRLRGLVAKTAPRPSAAARMEVGP